MKVNSLQTTNKNSMQEQLDGFLNTYLPNLYGFINYQDKADIVLDDKADTFYFSPKEKKVGLPLKWRMEYLTTQDVNKGLQGKIGIAHEFSHFRDLLRERITTGKGSMYSVLKGVSEKKLIVDENTSIPIGQLIHTFYNCSDDIIINEEVMRFIRFNLGRDDFKHTYQTINFADYIVHDGGEYKKTSNGYVFVGEGEGDYKLNVKEAVDYSQIPNYNALSYYFLRKAMVPDQNIVLPETTSQLLFSSGTNKSLSRKKSYEKLSDIIDKEQEKALQSSDPKVVERVKKYSTLLSIQKQKLKSVETLTNIQNLINIVWKKISFHYDVSKLNPFQISLQDIIYSLSLSKGNDHNHELCIMPSLRYQIYQTLFEPIVESLILLDLLYNDIDDLRQGEGEGEGKGEGKGKTKKNMSGQGTYERSLEDTLKTLEDIEDYQEEKEKNKSLEEQKKQTALQISSLAEDYGVSSEDERFTLKVKQNFASYTKDILDLLYKELAQIDYQLSSEKQISKKGKLNYDAFIEELPSSFLDGDFGGKNIYEKNEFHEILDEKFKKLLFYFVVDVSGSTDGFKGENGLMNGIITSLTIALKNVEKNIQNMIGDPDYEIPVKYVIYTDSVVYPNNTTGLEKLPYEVELMKVNKVIHSVSGGTNDVQGWGQISNTLVDDLNKNTDYVDEIRSGDRKPVILQIADSDVTDYGLEVLQEKLEQKFGSIVKNSMLTKRIILGEKIERTYSEDELKKGWSWRDEYVRDRNGEFVLDKNGQKLITVKEVGVRSKGDIINQIAKIFNNFFTDIQKK